MLFSASAFAQESDDMYFFASDRAIPSSISEDARLKPVISQDNNLVSKYANPDFNGDVALSDQSFDYYSEDPINENYVFGDNTLYSNPWGNPWAMNNFGPYSAFNDPFFSPYYPYASRMGMGFGMSPWGNRFGMGMSPWGWGGSRFGMNFGFNSMFAPSLAWGMGSRFYDPFFNPYLYDPFFSPYNNFAMGGFGAGFYGNRFYNPYGRGNVVVVERNVRPVSQRINRGNAPSYSRNSDNSARMAAYRPSSDANRAASSRLRNIEQFQQRISNRGSVNVRQNTNTSNNYGNNSSYSYGRSSNNARYTNPSSGYNSGRSSYSRPSTFSSPSRSSGFSGSSSGRSSAPVRRGRQ